MMLWINLSGLALIALIIWWFWLYKPEEVSLASGDLSVRVENGVYAPARLKAPANTALALQFLRVDASPCAETLIFPELDISRTLPLNQAARVALPALAPGVYHFHCQMQMYRGELHVA